MQIYLFKFYNVVVGLPALYTGLALALAIVWDAITDPLMGGISDRSRWSSGRRRPYLLPGAALLAVSFIWIFNPPPLDSNAARFAFLLISFILQTQDGPRPRGTLLWRLAHGHQASPRIGAGTQRRLALADRFLRRDSNTNPRDRLALSFALWTDGGYPVLRGRTHPVALTFDRRAAPAHSAPIAPPPSKTTHFTRGLRGTHRRGCAGT